MRKIIKSNLFVLLILIISCSFILSACDMDKNNNSNDSNNQTTVELTMSNYTQYVYMQQEVMSSTSTPYTKVIQGTNFSFTRASQSTKISALVMQNNTEFQDVTITVRANDLRNSQGTRAEWNAPRGTLVLNYKGEGFVMLNATYDWWSENYLAPVTYSVVSVTGSVIVKN